MDHTSAASIALPGSGNLGKDLARVIGGCGIAGTGGCRSGLNLATRCGFAGGLAVPGTGLAVDLRLRFFISGCLSWWLFGLFGFRDGRGNVGRNRGFNGQGVFDWFQALGGFDRTCCFRGRPDQGNIGYGPFQVFRRGRWNESRFTDRLQSAWGLSRYVLDRCSRRWNRFAWLFDRLNGGVFRRLRCYRRRAGNNGLCGFHGVECVSGLYQVGKTVAQCCFPGIGSALDEDFLAEIGGNCHCRDMQQ